MKLEGKVAIVTGGGQGLGEGIVRCLAEEGAEVVVVDINEDAAKKIAAEIEAPGRRSLAIGADVTDETDVAAFVQKTIDTFGKIDILVNNVGGSGETRWDRTSPSFADQKWDEWEESFALNLKTQVLACRAVAPYFIEQKSGKVVNISSIGGKTPNPQIMCYGAFKAAVIHFTKSLARELARHNINVNCVCPGVIYTPLQAKSVAELARFMPQAEGLTTREAFLKFRVAGVPLQREQTEEDIGRAVAFLASDDARNITGQSLNVDGGAVVD